MVGATQILTNSGVENIKKRGIKPKIHILNSAHGSSPFNRSNSKPIWSFLQKSSAVWWSSTVTCRWLHLQHAVCGGDRDWQVGWHQKLSQKIGPDFTSAVSGGCKGWVQPRFFYFLNSDFMFLLDVCDELIINLNTSWILVGHVVSRAPPPMSFYPRLGSFPGGSNVECQGIGNPRNGHGMGIYVQFQGFLQI